MGIIRALLVGIDTYRAARLPALTGCGNDITAAAAFLRSRITDGIRLDLRELRDDDATRAAVIEGIAGHLGAAGPGDTALFWFSGHGSQAPVPARFRHLESGPYLQTLVCADSRTGGVPDLLDKELSVLLDAIARRGVHVAVVLDSCHSGGATREMPEEREPAVRVRSVPAATDREMPALLLPELGGRPFATVGTSGVEHVALAAARRFERAQERELDGQPRGLFSWALLRALNRLGPAATYRGLLTAARAEVELLAYRQIPQLYPEGPGPADRPFLGGAVVAPGAGMTLRYAREGWELDAGSCHGLPAGDDLQVAVPGTTPLREALVVRLLTARSLVEPIGWTPDHERQYPVVVSRVPLPATTVVVGGRPGDDAATAGHIVGALRRAAPGTGPSPYVHILDPSGPTVVPDFRIATRPGAARLEGPDGTAIGGEMTGLAGAGVDAVVRRLEHVARWRQIYDLQNPLSRLAGAVTMEVVRSSPGRAPDETDPVVLAEDGEIRLRYERHAGRWHAPEILIRLRNQHRRRLYCVLLDLTGGYRVHAGLFPGDFVDPGATAWALRGRPVRVALPAAEPVVPGRRVRDWLKLLVAEEQFGTGPFELPPVGTARRPVRGPMALPGLPDRLDPAGTRRNGGVDRGYDWTALTLPVVTEVPAADRPSPAGMSRPAG